MNPDMAELEDRLNALRTPTHSLRDGFFHTSSWAPPPGRGSPGASSPRGDTCDESDSARLQAKRARHQEFVRRADATGVPSRVSRAIMRSPGTVTLADLVAFLCQQDVVDF